MALYGTQSSTQNTRKEKSTICSRMDQLAVIKIIYSTYQEYDRRLKEQLINCLNNETTIAKIIKELTALKDTSEIRSEQVSYTMTCRFFVVAVDCPTLLGMLEIKLLNIIRITCKVICEPHESRKFNLTIEASNSPSCRTNRTPWNETEKVGTLEIIIQTCQVISGSAQSNTQKST